MHINGAFIFATPSYAIRGSGYAIGVRGLFQTEVKRQIVQQPKAIYLANPVSSDKVFFSVDYISFGCI